MRRINRAIVSFWQLLAINLCAVYAPAIFWVHDLPGTGNTALIFLYSPIAMSLLFMSGSSSLVPPTVILILVMTILVASSWSYREVRSAKIVMPITLFILSLAQGMFFAEAIHGINGIGGS